MAINFGTISAPVGTRNGQTVMPNNSPDLGVVTDLFDRISVSKGGTAEIGGLWATERGALIAEVTAQIITFQTVNRRPVIDGVIDPNGGTLKLMNQLATSPAPAGISATVVPAPGGQTEDGSGQQLVADVNSLPGTGSLRPIWVPYSYVRRLVKVDGSSIKWFGVVIPRSTTRGIFGSVPHINFTPTPIQGGYHDSTYESFGGWEQLWADYTSVIGGQMAASGADQVLVIPFYRNAQYNKLGDFLSNWQDVVASAVTAAINSIDPLFLRNTFTFDRIVSSSFSNGWVTHQHFNAQAVGAAAKTNILFDLDGITAKPSSNWRPTQGVIYLDRSPRPQGNPVSGMHWYVGGRWKSFSPFYPAGLNTHACCRNHLLFHGLWNYCT